MHKRRGRDDESGLPSWGLGEREREKKRHACLVGFSCCCCCCGGRKEGGGGEVVYRDVHDLYSSTVVFQVLLESG